MDRLYYIVWGNSSQEHERVSGPGNVLMGDNQRYVALYKTREDAQAACPDSGCEVMGNTLRRFRDLCAERIGTAGPYAGLLLGNRRIPAARTPKEDVKE